MITGCLVRTMGIISDRKIVNLILIDGQAARVYDFGFFGPMSKFK